MKIDKIPFQNTIKITRNKELENIYDLELNRIEELKKFHSIEASVFIYPFSRKITSRHIWFNPFEEYVKDILVDQRSAYMKITNQLNNLFGIFLGVLIVLVFYLFKPVELLSIESIVSVFGAYMIGKELWTDIEKGLMNLTKNWKIRLEENKYAYKLERNTMLTHYSYMAKKQRYGKNPLLPEKMHFITQSNSQIVRMYFNAKDLRKITTNRAHILSMHIDKELINEFEKHGYMLTVRINFNKHFLWWMRSWEFYQSLNRNILGSINQNGKWHKNSVFYQKIISLKRIMHFIKKEQLKDKFIIKK